VAGYLTQARTLVGSSAMAAGRPPSSGGVRLYGRTTNSPPRSGSICPRLSARTAWCGFELLARPPSEAMKRLEHTFESTGSDRNSVLAAVGLDPAPFLYDQHWALLSVAFVNAWAIVPFNTLVFRAAVLNIPGELFEAAQLDGATRWQEIKHVILPTLRPTTVVLAVLTIVYGFRSFDFIYVMTQGGPGSATETLPFASYKQAFVGYDFGQGSATAIVAVLLVLVLAVIYSRSVLKEEQQ
jgi:ABC-type polysaccharide transport system permease subunit